MEHLTKDCYIIIERALRMYSFYLHESMDTFLDKVKHAHELALTDSVLAAVVEHLQNTF